MAVLPRPRRASRAPRSWGRRFCRPLHWPRPSHRRAPLCSSYPGGRRAWLSCLRRAQPGGATSSRGRERTVAVLRTVGATRGPAASSAFSHLTQGPPRPSALSQSARADSSSEIWAGRLFEARCSLLRLSRPFVLRGCPSPPQPRSLGQTPCWSYAASASRTPLEWGSLSPDGALVLLGFATLAPCSRLVFSSWRGPAALASLQA